MTENAHPRQESEEEPTSPLPSTKRPAPLLKDATKFSRKKNRSENAHLPASDVRSNYHRILETIFNGCQKAEATKHFKSICSDDCVMISRSVNNPFGPNYRELRGIESMVEFVDTSLEAVPDCIFAITDSKFFRKPQNESMIISSYTVNGRMIYTVDRLESEDVEDIDSAISGLQMLYQGGSCGGAEAEAVQFVCNQVESAASKIGTTNTGGIRNLQNDPAPTPADALYAFVYNTATASQQLSGSSTSATYAGGCAGMEASRAPNPLPISALADAASRAQCIPTPPPAVVFSAPSQNTTQPTQPAPPPAPPAVVEPFDYSMKFTNTGASLFEPSIPNSDEDDDIEEMGRRVAAAAGAVAGGISGGGMSNLASMTASLINPVKEESFGIGVSSSSGLATVNATGELRANSSNGSLHSAPMNSSNGISPTALPSFNSTSNSTSTSTGLPDSNSSLNLSLADLSLPGKDSFWLKNRSNVMIVKEAAKFCLKEKIPLGQQVYKVKGTLTLQINSEKKVRKIELLHSFDTSMHR
mmetsp:Transcript_62403/g.122759  ORF Transcript_62403/g.122759 Transcript_62403/m.122759 type:complete len:529 (+) Transcript_62403:3-1589(+)